MYFGLGAVQTKFGGAEVSSVTKRGITYNEVTEAYKKNNYKVTFGKRLNKNFAVEWMVHYLLLCVGIILMHTTM
jgi:hypothetical protein